MSEPRYRFDFLCPKTWPELPADNKRTTRFCDHCKRDVYQVDNNLTLGIDACCLVPT